MALSPKLWRGKKRLKTCTASGSNANGSTAKAAGAGVKHFLPKPYTAETLRKTVQRNRHRNRVKRDWETRLPEVSTNHRKFVAATGSAIQRRSLPDITPCPLSASSTDCKNARICRGLVR